MVPKNLPNFSKEKHFRGALNSARDFAPRIFASMLYGHVAFAGIDGTNSENFFWIPLFGPLFGGALAGMIYLLFICAHWPKMEKTTPSLAEL